MSSLRVLVLFALLGVALASSDASQIGFAGTWTDNGGFGKDLFMCTPTATTLYGSYSEFGVLVGYLSNFREAAGYWYDACIGKCCHGEFAFKLSTDGNSFTGSYTCSENPHKSFDWSETRNLSARTQTPNDYQCAALTPTRNSMAHKWVPKSGTTEWDICFDGSSSYYNSSYVYDDASGLPVLGYESGNVFQVGRIIQGYFDEEGRSGTSLTVRTNGNEAVSFFWVTNGRNVTVNGQNFDNPALHGRIIYKLDQSGEPTTLECFRNDFLSSAPQTVNAGVSVTCSKALLAMAAVIAALLLLL